MTVSLLGHHIVKSSASSKRTQKNLSSRDSNPFHSTRSALTIRHRTSSTLRQISFYFLYFIDEAQSIGLWNNQGRVQMSRAIINGDRSSWNTLRFIEPGQTLYCSRATSAKVYFRINLKKLFAITRILFIGEAKRAGPFMRCLRDESRKLLSLFSSLDGKLWSPFGIYNQVHGDKINQVTQMVLTSTYLRYG